MEPPWYVGSSKKYVLTEQRMVKNLKGAESLYVRKYFF